MNKRNRARGALLGLAVGDALGTTLEFKKLDAPAFPELAQGPHRSIVGGGPFSVKPGQVTDDTHMATCLAESLREKGAFDADDVAARYVEWLGHAFDVGSQTAAALQLIERRQADPATAGRIVWEQRGRQAAGNGSLMRTAPIGVFFAHDGAALRDASRQESCLTHFDPRCQEACVAFNAAIAAAVSASAGPTAAWQAAQRAITRTDLRADLAVAAQDDPDLYGDEVNLHAHQGFVRVAFRLAFWELLHAPSFEAALIDVVNRGGDADTNGAITGALLGAVYGEEAIPRAWGHTVLNALEDGPPGVFRDRYHPAVLLRLVP